MNDAVSCLSKLQLSIHHRGKTMKNVSALYKNVIKNGGPFFCYAKVTLSTGEELILTSEKDFYITGSNKTEDGGSGFPLGVALSKTVTLLLENSDERFTKYDFYYAQIALYTEADISDSKIERIYDGVYTVLSPIAAGDTIELTGYDDMYKTDREFESGLEFPVTARQLLDEVCTKCGILLGTPLFNNYDYSITTPPEKTTARKIIGYIAMLAVGNAVMDNGKLAIKSYDFSPYSNMSDDITPSDLVEGPGYHIVNDYISSPDIGTDDVTITGISTTVKKENEDIEILYGTDDYTIKIENPLITGQEEESVKMMGESLVGVTIRRFSGEFFPNPTVEFMDLICIVDRKDKVYRSFITSHEFTYLGMSNFQCNVNDPERQKGKYYSNSAEMYQNVKKDLSNNKTQWETAIEELGKSLKNTSGMYETNEEQEDGSTITYIHDKPTIAESKNIIKITSDAIGISNDGGETYPYGFVLTGELIAKMLYTVGISADYIRSGTLTLGGENNKYGVLVMLDKNGNEVGRWNNGELYTSSAQIKGGNIDIQTDEKSNNLIVLTAKETYETGDTQTISSKFYPYGVDITSDGVFGSSYAWFHDLQLIMSDNKTWNYGNYVYLAKDGLQIMPENWINSKKERFLFDTISGLNTTKIQTKYLYCSGTKSRIADTQNYKNRLLYCYEMTSPMFGDIGEAVTDENGEAIIDINDIFQETVSTNIEYQVFLQKEGKGDIWVQEKHETFFIIKGTENLKFAWEIKVKQRDYEYEKMEEFSFEKEEEPVSVEYILEADNRAYLNKQEEILNENS